MKFDKEFIFEKIFGARAVARAVRASCDHQYKRQQKQQMLPIFAESARVQEIFLNGIYAS